MPLRLGSDTDLYRLVDLLQKPFNNRDRKWKHRRTVRYRQMEEELKSLPLNPTISDKALMVYQSEAPNQEIHKRTKRLVANPPRFEVVIYDDDPTTQQTGQQLEDGLKALYRWMNRGKVAFDWKVTEYQQGDGLGIGKIEYVPGHGDSLGPYDLDGITKEDEDEEVGEDREQRGRRNKARGEYRKAVAKYKNDSNAETKAYADVTDVALQSELPPFRLLAIDPLTCYWWEDDDGIEVIAETGMKSLNPLLAVFKSYGLGISEDGSRLFVTPGDTAAVGAETSPGAAGGTSGSANPASFWRGGHDLSQSVKYTEIRTRYEIAILIDHPKIKSKNISGQSRKEKTDRGVVLRFANPFGPYTTGYSLVPGDVTTETDPADAYQPPALAALNAAQPQNVLMTARLSAALEGALAPPYVKASPEVQMTATDEDKTPEAKQGRQVPVIPGEIKRVEAPLADLERIDERIAADTAPNVFREVLEGGAASEATGHRLAIQVGQADLQMVPYQNARAKALTELLKGILYAVRSHGLTIFIPTIPGGARTSTKGGLRVAEYAKLTPEMADLNFELIITVGSETPVTKYAKDQHLRDREEAGTIGYQTIIEQSDVENPMDEIARVFEGKLLKATMEQAIPLMTQMLMKYIEDKLFPPPLEEVEGEQMQLPFETPPQTGLAAGGGTPPGAENMPRSPGMNMPLVQTVQSGPGAGGPDIAGVGAVQRGF